MEIHNYADFAAALLARPECLSLCAGGNKSAPSWARNTAGRPPCFAPPSGFGAAPIV